MFSECFILDCCAVIAAKSGKCASSIQIELYTQQNNLIPKCAFYSLLCVKVVDFFFLFIFFNFNFILFFEKKKKLKQLQLLSPFVHVFLFCFSYLVAIKDFLIFEMEFQCCCVWHLFLSLSFFPPVFSAVELSLITVEWDWMEELVIDSFWLDL